METDYEEFDGTKGMAKTVLKWKDTGLAIPFSIDISLTNACNLSCLPCVARDNLDFRPAEEMTDAEVLGLISDAISLGVRRFHLTGGGEPMCRHDLILSIIDLVKRAKRELSMVTNGTLFTEKMIDAVCFKGVDKILFSIDRPDKNTDDHLRGNGAFEKSTNAVSRISDRRLEKKPWLCLAPVISKENAKQLSSFVDLAVQLGADQIHAQPILIRKKDYDYMRIPEKLAEQVIEEIDSATLNAEDNGIICNFKELDMSSLESSSCLETHIKEDRVDCFFPWTHIFVSSQGAVTPCPMMDEYDAIGNIKDRPLEKIWSNVAIEDMRVNLFKGIALPSCRGCCPSNILFNRKVRKEIERCTATKKKSR